MSSGRCLNNSDAQTLLTGFVPTRKHVMRETNGTSYRKTSIINVDRYRRCKKLRNEMQFNKTKKKRNGTGKEFSEYSGVH